MARRDRGRREIQVRLLWRDTLLDVFQFPEKQGEILAGSESACHLALPADLLPHPDFPLMRVEPDGVWVRAGRDAGFERQEPDGAWKPASTIADPARLGVVACRVDDGTRLRLGLGALRLVFARVEARRARRPRINQSLEPSFLNSLLLVSFLAAGFFATLLLGPRALGAPDARLHRRPSPYLFRLVSRVRSNKPPAIDANLRAHLSTDPDSISSGTAGKAGKPGAPDTGHRKAYKGKDPNDPAHLAGMGLLAALGEGPGMPGSPDGSSTGLGGDMIDAIGGMTGGRPGTSGGFGGLAQHGLGPGAGGPPGPISVGVAPSRPKISRLGPRPVYSKPVERSYQITRGELTSRGSLPPGVIRSVIRSHRQQIRYCYERSLTRWPQLAGKLRVHFVIDSRGRVRLAAGRTDPAIRQTDLAGCILRRVRTWIFPPPRGGGEVEVHYPFLFAPAAGR